MTFRKIPLTVALAVAGQAHAADLTLFDNFTALIGNPAAGSLPETAPFRLSSPNFSQVALANRSNQNQLVPASNSGNWDMIAVNESGADAGRYLFMPFETGSAGVQRVDLWNTDYNARTVTIVAPGTRSFASGDASRWTPWGGLLTAEESWGAGSSRGRLFEVTNATTVAANGATFVQRSVIPRVAHEGLAFDTDKSLYFIDERNGGSVYKFVSANPNASSGDDYLAAGQTFVLKVGAGGQFEGNYGAALTGAATWVAITDGTGGALAGISTVLADGTIDGRASADNASVLATGYNRPEDLEIQTLADGTQIIYFATTDSDDDGNSGNGRGRIYSLNLSSNEVKLAADNSTIDVLTGLAVGSSWSNPDNLAIDANGNIYVVEDQPGGIADIWFLFDDDRNGIAESVAKWAPLTTIGAEPTGLYFDRFNTNVAYLNVQHPDSANDMLMQISAVPSRRARPWSWLALA